MLAALKGEFRKLITVRSTYFIIGIALLMEFLFAFWGNGYKAFPETLQFPGYLQTQIVDAVSALSLIAALVAVLQITHEYRYNTITYTLTAAKSRTKLLVSKVLVLSAFSVLFTIFMATLSPLLVILGAHLADHSVGPQHIYYQDFVWNVLFYGWGYMMAGLLLGLLIRNQVGSLAALLLLPGVVEQLLGLLLKDNRAYLPFTALDAVAHVGTKLTDVKAAGVYLIYLLVGWALAFILFQKRDGN